MIESATYKNADDEDVVLSSTGTKFQYFGVLTLDDDNVETTTLVNPDNVDVTTSGEAETAYYAVQDKIDGYNEEVSYLYEKIGTSEVDLTLNDADGNWAIRVLETNMANFVPDAYKAMTGAEIAIVNAGGIRAAVDAGDVTRKSLMDVNPWNNQMCVVMATGQQILDALEFGARLHPENNAGFLHTAGLTYELHDYIESPVVTDSSNSFVKIEEGKDRRIANVKVNGEAIDPEREYILTATKYMLQDGGDGFTMFKDCEVIVAEGLACDSEMLIHYLKDTLGGVITEEKYGQSDGRIKVFSSEEETIVYKVKVAGIQVNYMNAEDILGDGTVSYDAETNTLTLNNADISTSRYSEDYPIYAEGDLNIVLIGENKISSGSEYGIFVNGSLAITGDVSALVVKGFCGEDAEYTLDISSGVLTISGSGEMTDYEQADDVPWSGLKDFITKIVVEDGITYIGNNAFSGCEELSEVYFEGNAPELAGDSVFSDTPENLKIIINKDAAGFEGDVWDDMNIVIEGGSSEGSGEGESDEDESDEGKSEDTDNKTQNTPSVNGSATATGDSANVMLWAVAAALSMAALVMVRSGSRALICRRERG